HTPAPAGLTSAYVPSVFTLLSLLKKLRNIVTRPRFAPFAVLFFHRHGSGLGYGALVIEGEETAQDFLASRGADRVADTVVLGQGFDFVEVVTQVEVVPAVGVADGFIEFPM